MAGLQIEGDLTYISNNQLKYIKSVIEGRGYRNNKVIIEQVGQAGDNYNSSVKRIIIEDGERGTFKMVAKIAHGLEMIRQMANTEFLFRNEHIMYTKVLPKLTQFEKTYDVPLKDRLRYATLYGSSQEVPHEVILLEDLNESGFIMLDRLKPISPDCVKSVLRNFAFLHSLSYVFKYKEPTLFEEYKDSLYDAWGAVPNSQEEILAYFKQLENNASKLVDSDIHKNAIDGSITAALKDISKMTKYEKNSKHAIIQQGDAWTNNLMFKFDGETPPQSIMIDYQASKPTNPVADILYMISNCTDYKMRKEHFYAWIDYYHSELEKSLSNYGLKVNFVFPRDQLDVDLKRHGKGSFGLSILLAGILTMKATEISEQQKALENEDVTKLLQEKEVGSKDSDTIALLKNRLEGLVDSYKDFGLI